MGQGAKKGGPLASSPPGLAVFVSRDPAEDESPKALTLATACVQLWAPERC